MSAPGAVRRLPLLVALLTALGFEHAEVPGAAGDSSAVLTTFAASDTFRWLRFPAPKDAAGSEGGGSGTDTDMARGECATRALPAQTEGFR